MLLSKYFLPVLKEKPQDSTVVSHTLMLRSGMIEQQSSGIYAWLPLGLKILKNIEKIVRFNMDASGCLEILMPCVQPSELWIESGRFDSYGKELLRFFDRHENEMLFGPTNEDMITRIFRNHIRSYKDLPKNLYHIQWKFRDEIRPRFGVMRAREFLMKDAYSFDIDRENAIKNYYYMYMTYMRTFANLGLKVIPVAADNGPIGGSLSHEFHVIASTGESTIYYDNRFDFVGEDLMEDIDYMKSLYAVSDEKYVQNECNIKESSLSISKGIEVGHIFYIGDYYSHKMNAVVSDQNGILTPVQMCSYGIGISRLVAAIIEANHDDKGIIWPEKVAPFKVSLINLDYKDQRCVEISNALYQQLQNLKIDTLYDDTDARAGSKFATHDLIGSPWHIIIGKRNIDNNLVEIKKRGNEQRELVSIEIVAKMIQGFLAI